jgi:hypothetical protein
VCEPVLWCDGTMFVDCGLAGDAKRGQDEVWNFVCRRGWDWEGEARVYIGCEEFNEFLRAVLGRLMISSLDGGGDVAASVLSGDSVQGILYSLG